MFHIQSEVKSMWFLEDNMLVAGVSNNNVVVLDPATGTVVRELSRHEGWVYGMAMLKPSAAPTLYLPPVII